MATIIGTNGNDILPRLSDPPTTGRDTIIGRAGNDRLSGHGENDRLQGGLGKDRLDGGAGVDTADYGKIIIGGTTYTGATDGVGVTVNLNLTGEQNTVGAGPDTLMGIENLTGTNFNDALAGNSLSNVLKGQAGSDIMAGGAGIDHLFGENDDDLLNGGVGNDRLNGGAGSDTADYGTFIIGGQAVTGATAGVTVNLNLAGQQNTVGAGLDTLMSIENLTGSNFNDTLTGNSADNKLTGRAGHDILNGGEGKDTLQGDSGNDTLNGGGGFDDTASYSTATAGVTVEVNGAGAQNTGGAGIDTLVDIENLIGSNFNDMLTVNYLDPDGFEVAGEFTLNGGAGNDTLRGPSFPSGPSAAATLNGGAGNDILSTQLGDQNGGDGDDHLASGEGDGRLDGGTGNDVLDVGDGFYELIGGTGNDRMSASPFLDFGGYTMYGGAGADTMRIGRVSGAHEATVRFDYKAVNDSPAGAGRDKIDGFRGNGAATGEEGENKGDVIDLITIDANTTVSAPGNQAFTWIGGGRPTAAGQLRYDNGLQLLQGYTDANLATPEIEIKLVGVSLSELFVSSGHPGTDILL